MKRDMNLIRAIVLALQEKDDDSETGFKESLEAHYGPMPSFEVLHYHYYLLLDAGFIEGTRADDFNSMFVVVNHLTWAGHEFADLAASDTTWNKLVGAAQEKSATLSFEFVKTGLAELAKFGAKQLVASQFGFPLS